MTLVLIGVVWHAHRMGNEPRDVALLGVVAGISAAGTAASALF
jgi:hypothetical protein